MNTPTTTTNQFDPKLNRAIKRSDMAFIEKSHAHYSSILNQHIETSWTVFEFREEAPIKTASLEGAIFSSCSCFECSVSSGGDFSAKPLFPSISYWPVAEFRTENEAHIWALQNRYNIFPKRNVFDTSN